MQCFFFLTPLQCKKGKYEKKKHQIINRLSLSYIYFCVYTYIYIFVMIGLYMSTQLLARSFLMAGAWSICSVRPGRGGRGSCETRFRPLRELLRFSCGLCGRRTDAKVVMWNTSRTLFSETLEVHSTYATAPIWRAIVLPWNMETGKEEMKKEAKLNLKVQEEEDRGNTHHFNNQKSYGVNPLNIHCPLVILSTCAFFFFLYVKSWISLNSGFSLVSSGF